jgi:hypothetical protein
MSSTWTFFFLNVAHVCDVLLGLGFRSYCFTSWSLFPQGFDPMCSLLFTGLLYPWFMSMRRGSVTVLGPLVTEIVRPKMTELFEMSVTSFPHKSVDRFFCHNTLSKPNMLCLWSDEDVVYYISHNHDLKMNEILLVTVRITVILLSARKEEVYIT